MRRGRNRADQHGEVGQQHPPHDSDACIGGRAPSPGSAGVVDCQVGRVKQPEDQELQPASVPDAGQPHRHAGRQRHEDGEAAQAPPVEARPSSGDGERKRIVEKQCQPTRQRHMPALPVFDHALCFVGRGEVLRGAHVQHARQTDRHVGIPGKIKIELQRVGQRHQPRAAHRQCLGLREPRRDHRADLVREHALLEQADEKDRDANGKVVRIEPVGGRLGELRHDFAIVQDRSGDQMRKERHEQRVIQHRTVSRQPLPAIDQVADLGEGEEADPKRQRRRREDNAERAQNPGQIFAVGKRREVGRDPARQHGALHARSRRRRTNQPGNGEIAGNRGQQHRQVRRVPPAVEDQRGGNQPASRNRPTEPAGGEKPGQRDRQEPQHERVRVEQHAAASRRHGVKRRRAPALPQSAPRIPRRCVAIRSRRSGIARRTGSRPQPPA